jgi:2-methylcitrate dehydratase PrpD
MTKPASRVMAAYLSGLQLRDLPSHAVTLLRRCVLDWVGCAIGALAAQPAAVMHAYAEACGPGPCSVVGRRQGGAAETAATVNGTLSHTLVFDDLHRHAKLHPGVAVIPAAIAIAETTHANGAQMLTAIAAGYEATARVGVAFGMASHRLKGWRATGTAGSFGAAAAAAQLLRLDSTQSHHALACAAAQASGNWAFQESGGMELYLAAGTAARNGVVAGRLAGAGFIGAAAPLEAADGGFFMLSSDEYIASVLTDQLGSRFRLLDTCIKMHPTCHSTQTGLDAALLLRERHDVRPADVDHVVVRAGEITRLQCGWAYEPAPPAKLIFHMGYAIAVALRNGRVMPTDFEGPPTHDPELVRLARATEVIADPALTAIYAARKPCEVTLILRNGQAFSETVEYCRGEPENPADDATVMAKFRGLAEPFLTAYEMDELAGLVLALDRAEYPGRLFALLREARRP